MGAKAFGEQNPTQGEDPVSWQTWSDGSGGHPTVVGNADWGKMQLDLTGEQGRSAVYDTGSTASRTFIITENRYGSGSESATLQIRGDTSSFNQDDASPAWEDYIVPVTHTWRYVQIREITNATDSSVLLQYHNIMEDSNGDILPWYEPYNLGKSFDQMLDLVFDWWLDIEPIAGEPAGVPYYVMHQIWQEGGQSYGTGGDQLAMALSSWRLYYAYCGDSRAKTDMVTIADIYLDSSLSASDEDWPYLPFPYQTVRPAGLDTWDGDMHAGAGYTQPDKAGSFGYELLNLYKMTGTAGYLTAAVNIANTLASKTVDGDDSNSPLPYRVLVTDGTIHDTYTTNWASTLMLWEDLITMNQGNVSDYNTAHGKIITWLKTYPVADDDWGPFFEDVGAYSDTAINAGTMAMYILDHRETWGANWAANARSALDWVYSELGNSDYSTYGVTVVNEQTVYRVNGQSHTSRQASVELRYAELTKNYAQVANAVRQLAWATYMVDNDGQNYYPSNACWLTDGYGDYVRHYIRAMAALPYLAPNNENHLLRTSSVVKTITYASGNISYETYDAGSTELLRVDAFDPTSVTAGGTALTKRSHISDLDTLEGWTLGADTDLPSVLRIRHNSSGVIVIT